MEPPIGRPPNDETLAFFLVNGQEPRKEVEEKEDHGGKNHKGKEAVGENKVHDTPSKLQEGPVLHEKHKKSKKKQSTTLAPSGQKKSLGLTGSAKKNGFFEFESKNAGDLRQKRNQTEKKWKR